MARGILRSHGVRGLYIGMPSQIARDMTFYGTFFGSYEVCTAAMREHTDLPEGVAVFLSGDYPEWRAGP